LGGAGIVVSIYAAPMQVEAVIVFPFPITIPYRKEGRKTGKWRHLHNELYSTSNSVAGDGQFNLQVKPCRSQVSIMALLKLKALISKSLATKEELD
jgi:hypothetical protein